MSDGQVRLATILLVVLVAITAVVRYWEPPPEVDADATAVVWNFEAEKTSRLEVTRAEGGTIILARDGEDWRIEQPIQALAEPYLMRQVLEDLEALQKGVPMGDAPASVYGLSDPPRVRVRAIAADGSAKELWFGDMAPVGENVYARGAGGEVVAVHTRVIDVLAAPADNWRDRRVVQFPTGEVRAVQIASAEGTLRVEREGDRWWSRGFTRAEADKVDDLLLGLLDLRFDEFVPPAPIDTPRYTVSVELGDRSAVRIVVGEADAMGSAKVSVEGGASGTIAVESLALLGQGPTDVGDREAFVLDETAAKKVEVKLGTSMFVLERDGEGWTRGGKPEPKAQAWIEAIQRTPIVYRREPVAALRESWGFVRVTDAVGSYTVELGQLDDDAHRVARDAAGGEPYRVPVAALAAIEAVFSGP